MRPIEQIKRALDADSRSGISSMAPIGCESQGGHAGLDPGLIDEHQTPRVEMGLP